MPARKTIFAAMACAAMLAWIAGCSRTGSGTGSSDAGGADTIPWRTDYAAALEEGKKSGKPILIDFSATWCPPCQEMKRSSWPDQRVNHLASTAYIPLSLDADAAGSKDPAERYGISQIPAVLVVDSDGKVLRQSAYMNADDLADFLAGR